MSTPTKSLFRSRMLELQGSLSNVEFAKRCGLNTQDIQRYSRGLASPTVEKLALIASSFSVSTDWLLGLSDTKMSSPLAISEERSAYEPPIPPVSRMRNAVFPCPNCERLESEIQFLRSALTEAISKIPTPPGN